MKKQLVLSRKKKHGNSYENDKPHHLYAFYDHEKRTIHKFGISADPIGDDGTSRRIYSSRIGLGNYRLPSRPLVLPKSLADAMASPTFFGKTSDHAAGALEFPNHSGLSIRRQYKFILQLWNVGRVTVRIIRKMIPNRKRAVELEDDCIESYVKKNGKLPNGNPDHVYRSHKWRKDKQ